MFELEEWKLRIKDFAFKKAFDLDWLEGMEPKLFTITQNVFVTYFHATEEMYWNYIHLGQAIFLIPIADLM